MGTSARNSFLPKLGLAMVAALLVASPAALASEDPTRAEYTARVEPICKSTTRAVEPILKGIKGLVLRDKLAAAGKRINRTSRARAAGLRKLSRVSRPVADTARLKKWIGYLKRAQRLLAKIAKFYKVGNKPAAFRLEVQHAKIERLANRTVLAFGFRNCKADSARFR